LVRAALGNQGEDLPLAWREFLERVDLSASREKLLDEGPVDDALARRDSVQRVEQLLDATPPVPSSGTRLARVSRR